MPLHLLIPCKPFAAGKSRLAPVLGDRERAALCARLLRQTLDCAVALVPAAACRLVSADGEAAALAAASGVAVLGDRGAGLNEALADARAVLRRAGSDAALLILPIDLPRVSAAALRRLIAVPAEVVAAPDRRGLGTNALYLSPAAAGIVDFRFGSGSFAAHRAAAASAGLSFAAHADPDIAFDIDGPDDLAEWRGAAISAPAARRSLRRGS
ncbi:MAG: 2-phospho-L-lactate guanylyltransferase [Stellaceae bacterium]